MNIEKLKTEEFEWLKNSDFFKSIDFEDDNDLEIPFCSKFEKNGILIFNVINFLFSICNIMMYSFFIKGLRCVDYNVLRTFNSFKK